MLEMGFIVGLGLLITFAKLGWRGRFWMLSHPVVMDVGIFILLIAIHWGTYSGVMVATIGALTCSLALAAGRWLFGYFEGKRFIAGRFVVKGTLQ